MCYDSGRKTKRVMNLSHIRKTAVQALLLIAGAAMLCFGAWRGEAATVLNRVLDLGDVELEVWFADREAAPSWAAQAVGNMEALNVLSVGSFGSDRLETAVTRADAARMLSAAGTLLRGEKDTGLLGLLKKS